MKFNLTIDCDGAAFDNDPAFEVIRLLDWIKNEMQNGRDNGKLHDHNGNGVGAWTFDGTRPTDDERIIAYHVVDMEGDDVESFPVKPGGVESDAFHDAKRAAHAMQDDHEDDLGMSEGDKEMNKHNDPYFHVEEENGAGERRAV